MAAYFILFVWSGEHRQHPCGRSSPQGDPNPEGLCPPSGHDFGHGNVHE